MKGPSNPAGPGRGCLSLLEGRRGTILILILVPLLLCAALVLPPISLPSRIMAAGYTNLTVAGAEVKNPDGMTVRIPQGAVAKNGAIKISATPQQAFSASEVGKALPAYLEAKSPYYSLDVQGERPKEVELAIPLPSDSEPYTTLDLWARYGQTWFKIPFTLNDQDQQIESTLNFVPDGMVVVQTQPQTPVIGAVLNSKDSLPDGARKVLTELNPIGLHLADEGAVAGDVLSMPETSASSPYSVVPFVSNSDKDGVRTDLTQNMLADEGQTKAHISTLVDLAVQKLYAGYNIQYDGLTSADQETYTAFIKELAKQLHAQNKILSVTLPAPKPVAEYEWDTAGYDWALISRYADEVKIPLLSDVKAFDGDNPLIEQYLQWATGQVDRNKLQVIVSTIPQDQLGDQYSPVAVGNALKLLGAISMPQSSAPGDKVLLDLPKLRDVGGIQHHQSTGLFYFNYKDGKGTAHTVWLEDADSIAKKSALLMKYNLRGLALASMAGEALPDPRIWAVLQDYHDLQASAIDTKVSIVWLVDGQVLGKVNSNDPKLTLTVPDAVGQHMIDVALSFDEGQTYSAGGSQVAVNVQKPTPTPTPKPTDVPTKVPTAKATKAPVAAGPQPTKAPAPAGPPGGNSAGTGFGYGIQVSRGNVANEMAEIKNMQFGWAKIQVPWQDVETGPGNYNTGWLDDFTNQASANGIKVLFSVVKAPRFRRGQFGGGGNGPPDNMQDAADFMSMLAKRYCGKLGAIEVWNEENLLTEWDDRRGISAPLYMDMLKRSYPAIKAACPQIVVVSSAPTPTGVNSATAIDDGTFLEQLYQNGLKQYSDTIGAHPSGFNVPAMCNDLDPACIRPSASYQAPWTNRHHSWGFLATMITYHNIMSKYGDGGKRIWATEFGWPVGNGGTACGGPCHPSGVDNSPTDVATWFVQAFQWAKQQPWVGVMFVWNLDFYGGEVGAFHIEGQPAYSALANMPK